MRRDVQKLVRRTAAMSNRDYRAVAQGRRPSRQDRVEQEFLQSLSRSNREEYLRQREKIDDEDLITALLLDWQRRAGL
jgi:hypothetical protein